MPSKHWNHSRAFLLFTLGMAVAAGWNVYRWRQDQRRIRQYAQAWTRPCRPLSGPLVTLLVAAWDEAPHIHEFITAFHNLRYPHKQLVLVAGGTDGTYPLASSRQEDTVTVLEQHPGEGKQRALGRGYACARGEIIFFTDVDCALGDDTFERTLQPIIQQGEQACSGYYYVGSLKTRDVWLASLIAPLFYTALTAPPYASGLLGGNCAITRMALEHSGALQAEAITGTDYILAKMLTRAGYRLRQNPLSLMPVRAVSSLPAYLRQQSRWMSNVILHGHRFGSPAESLQVLLSASMGLLMLLMPILALWLGPLMLAVWGVFYAYAVFARLRYLGAAQRAIGLPISLPLLLFQPIMLLVDYFAWAASLLNVLQHKRRDIW
jgi:cellulose synthase/poly-beta-1,6-N-acetylglucosamine synthase-like glycosyltransferase